MTRDELIAKALRHMENATWSPERWAEAIENGYKGKPYNYAATQNYEAQKALWAASRAFNYGPNIGSTFGTASTAGVFAGRGIMLGSNPDVWEQARLLARDGHVDVVAVIPDTHYDFAGARVVLWHPPHIPGSAPMVQAENPAEWDKVKTLQWDAIAINAREYGRLDGKVALVEAYYNDGQAADFNYFDDYALDLGAKAVIPLCGGWSSVIPDADAGAIYMDLAEWGTGRFPGFWLYAGESMLTAESIAALKAWRPA